MYISGVLYDRWGMLSTWMNDDEVMKRRLFVVAFPFVMPSNADLVLSTSSGHTTSNKLPAMCRGRGSGKLANSHDIRNKHGHVTAARERDARKHGQCGPCVHVCHRSTPGIHLVVLLAGANFYYQLSSQ